MTERATIKTIQNLKAYPHLIRVKWIATSKKAATPALSTETKTPTPRCGCNKINMVQTTLARRVDGWQMLTDVDRCWQMLTDVDRCWQRNPVEEFTIKPPSQWICSESVPHRLLPRFSSHSGRSAEFHHSHRHLPPRPSSRQGWSGHRTSQPSPHGQNHLDQKEWGCGSAPPDHDRLMLETPRSAAVFYIQWSCGDSWRVRSILD